MEPNKLEKEFRKQLNSREIKPSAMGWDKLDAMLTDAEGKKSKRSYGWIYIAASFIGFLIIGAVYFNQTEKVIENQKDKIVYQESASTKNLKDSSAILNSILKKNEDEVTGNIPKIAIKNNKKLITKEDSLTNKNHLNQNQIPEVSIINQKKESESKSISAKVLTVDELLASVNQSRSVSNKSNPDFKVRVNPNQLLQQIDNDLEPTFRQSAFSRIADNIKIVKDAVVNRNQE